MRNLEDNDPPTKFKNPNLLYDVSKPIEENMFKVPLYLPDDDRKSAVGLLEVLLVDTVTSTRELGATAATIQTRSWQGERRSDGRCKDT